jgi:class 3 adenylate cyclase
VLPRNGSGDGSLTGEHEALEDERVLATVLFTDIVGSTEKATSQGLTHDRACMRKRGARRWKFEIE